MPATIRYYVLARDAEQFRRWVAHMNARGLAALQNCNYLGTEDRMKGIGFTSIFQELVLLAGWNEGREQSSFMEGACELIARYCRDRRKHGIVVTTFE